MITVENIESLDKGTKKLLNKLSVKERKKVLRKAAAPIREDARSLISDAPDDVKRYSTAKVFGRLKAPKGQGNVVATYVPGNLRRAIQTLNFRKSEDIFVGPKSRKGSGKGVFGTTTRTADGYYAHMVHNGTSEFAGTPFMLLAFQAKKGVALLIIRKEFKKDIESIDV